MGGDDHHRHNDDHDDGHDGNDEVVEMVDAAQRHDEQHAPLLADEEQQGQQQHGARITSTRQVYSRNSVRSRSAVAVQTFGIAFVVLIWSLVLSAMPLTPLPLFGYHPMVQSLAFLLLLQAILTLQPTSHADAVEKRTAFRLHRLLNAALVLPLFTVGASIMWYLHDQPGTAHFISWHGILGTALIVLTWLQVAVGVAVTALDTAQTRALWKYHRLSGYVLLPAYAVVLFLGAARTDWARTNAGPAHHAAVLLSLVGVLVGIVSRTQWSKLPSLH